MFYPMMNGGYDILWFVWHVLGWALAIIFIVWVIRMIRGSRHGRCRHCMDMHGMYGHEGHDHAQAIVRERYAKGEITKEQYESMKKELE